MVDSKRTRGTNVVELQAVADPRTGTAVVVGAVDNLVKGAAGQAIQNLNLMLRARRGDRPAHAGGVPVSVTYPGGFRAAGVTAGFKPSGLPDLGLLVGDAGTTAAGLFTTNRVAAAPVGSRGSVSPPASCVAVLVNSGQANAATGERGMRDAVSSDRRGGGALRARPSTSVLPCSTGVIGEPLHTDVLLERAAVAGGRARAGRRRGVRARDHDDRHRGQAGHRRGRRLPRRWLREGRRDDQSDTSRRCSRS